MLISTWSDKGGAGKTTLAVHIASFFKAQLLDLDPQGDLTRWLESARERATENAQLQCHPLGKNPTKVLLEAAESDDLFVADCPPGRGTGGGSPGVAFSQIVVIPTRSGDADLVGLYRALQFVDTVKENGNPGLRAAVVLNAIRDTARARGVGKALGASPSYVYLGELKERVAYEEAYSAGTTVLAQANTPAAEEATGVLQKLQAMLKTPRKASRK